MGFQLNSFPLLIKVQEDGSLASTMRTVEQFLGNSARRAGDSWDAAGKRASDAFSFDPGKSQAVARAARVFADEQRRIAAAAEAANASAKALTDTDTQYARTALQAAEAAERRAVKLEALAETQKRIAAAYRPQQQRFAPEIDTRATFDRFRDGAASIDKAALSGRTLDQVLGRVADKAAGLAANSRRAADEQQRLAAETQKAAEAHARLVAESQNIVRAPDFSRSQIFFNPEESAASAAAARRQAIEMDLLARAAEEVASATATATASDKAFAIASREAATAANAEADRLDGVAATQGRVAAAVRSTGTQMAATGRAVAGGLNAQRFAIINAGQQMQDLVIQIGSGQRASVALAQQLPQLGFALSGLEGSTNKTLARLGAFGTYLSGPLGLIVPLTAFALGGLASSFGKVDEAAKDAQRSTDSFRDGLLDIQRFADDATGKMLKLADSTIRAAVAMNALKRQENEAKLVDLQGQGISAASAFSRAEGTTSRAGRGARAGKFDPDVEAALAKAGVTRTRQGQLSGGNLYVLEREIAAAAKRRPDLQGIANDISLITAESTEAYTAIKKLRDDLDFLTGKREIVPGFKPPKPDKGSSGTSGAQSGAEVVDLAVQRANAIREASEAIPGDIAKRLEAEAAKLETIGEIGDRFAEDRARQREAEQVDAEILIATYSQMLGLVDQIGGTTGKVASALNGLLTGNFAGLGKAGLLLNLTGETVGQDGWKQVTAKLDQIFGGTAGDGSFTRSMTKILQGAGIGSLSSSLILGSAGSGTGAAIGGALGGQLGQKFLSKGLEGVAKGLGDFAGPLGSIAGGLIGGALGGLFKKDKYGAVQLSSSGVSEASGNSGASKRAAAAAGGSFEQYLTQIAEQFGGSIADFGSITLGVRHGDYRVNTGGTSLKKKKGAVDFNEDGEAAISYAIQEAIRRGAIDGIRKSTQALLNSSDDLQANLTKALKFENVFRDLKAIKDPVGAAIDDLNREFKGLVGIFKEAGASTEEFAQLEELYTLKRKEAVEQAFEDLTSSLRNLLNDINVGDSGYSLSTRLTNARAAFDPLAARVQAGDTGAYDDFAQASRQLIDIARELYGSGTQYFAILDQVKNISQGELSKQQSIFDSTNATGTPDFSVQPVVDATMTATQNLIDELRRQGLLASSNSAVEQGYLSQIAGFLKTSVVVQAAPSALAYRYGF